MHEATIPSPLPDFAIPPPVATDTEATRQGSVRGYSPGSDTTKRTRETILFPPPLPRRSSQSQTSQCGRRFRLTWRRIRKEGKRRRFETKSLPWLTPPSTACNVAIDIRLLNWIVIIMIKRLTHKKGCASWKRQFRMRLKTMKNRIFRQEKVIFQRF